MENLKEIQKIIFLKALADDLFPIYKPVDWLFKKKKILKSWIQHYEKKEPIIVESDINICSRRFVVTLKKLLEKNEVSLDNFTLAVPENLVVNGDFVLTSGGPLWDNPVIIDTALSGVGNPYDDNPPPIPKGLVVGGNLTVDAERVPVDLEVNGTLYFAFTEQSNAIIIPDTAKINGINLKRKQQNIIFPDNNFSHIDVWESEVDNLPNVETLGYPNQWNWFNFGNCKIKRLPQKLKTVYGELNIGGDSFHYLTDDLTVIGNLCIYGEPFSNLKKLAKKLKITEKFQIEGYVDNKKFVEEKFGIEEFPSILDANEILLFNCQKYIKPPQILKCNRVYLRNCHEGIIKYFTNKQVEMGFDLKID
jgi:hypothetical protein